MTRQIVNLEQIDPLKVDFRVPERSCRLWRRARKSPWRSTRVSRAGLHRRGEALNPLVDAAGRAVVVRAVIANDEGKLRPGLFARVRLTLAERQNALFVPEEAIQPQGDQAFVFKVASTPATARPSPS